MFDPRQATVVIIDDDDGLRESLKALLQAVDYQCVSYASAEAYLEHPVPAPPSCLLLDLHLSGMSGLELQDEISRARYRPPILFISGDASPTEIDRAIAGGARDFLHKPFNPEELLDRTASCLRQSLNGAG